MNIRRCRSATLNELNGLLNIWLQYERTLAGSSDSRQAPSADPQYECTNHLVEVVEKLLGAKTGEFCTEAPFIQTLCPTLVLGPQNN